MRFDRSMKPFQGEALKKQEGIYGKFLLGVKNALAVNHLVTNAMAWCPVSNAGEQAKPGDQWRGMASGK